MAPVVPDSRSGIPGINCRIFTILVVLTSVYSGKNIVEMKHYLVFVLMLFATQVLEAQDCTCNDNYLWVKKTFEENDAGFTYALEQKGKEAYAAHDAAIQEQVQSITDRTECTQTLYQWLSFFRSGHIGIRNLMNTGQQAQRMGDEEIRAQFKDWETVDLVPEALESYLANPQHPLEGIYVNGAYKIGVKLQDDQLIGYIIEADGVYWMPGQVKLRINKAGNQGSYYMQDHSEERFEDIELLGNKYLRMGFVTMERIFPESDADPIIERYFQVMNSRTPLAMAVSEETFLIRIPTFAYSEKKLIDSIIEANQEPILKTPNLIIDIRNNGGGSDASYNELIPFLYTNPIRTVGVEFLSTPLNNERMIKFSKDPNWDEDSKQWALNSYELLQSRLGEFVDLDSNLVSVETRDTVYPYPQQVGILINNGNGSTSEQFLLAAKQSKKVKLFGTTTFGVLDISNMHFVPSPCEEFELGYCLTRSGRIPDMAIDDKGIMPDYYIGEDIPEYGWIDFVQKVLEE